MDRINRLKFLKKHLEECDMKNMKECEKELDECDQGKSLDESEDITGGLDKDTTAIIKLFSSDKKIKDHEDFHALAEELGSEPSVLEEKAYALIQSFFSQGNYMKDGQGKTFDKKEIDMGKKVELEHTNNPIIAFRISLDHLTEFPDYYTRLAKMEDEAKRMTECDQGKRLDEIFLDDEPDENEIVSGDDPDDVEDTLDDFEDEILDEDVEDVDENWASQGASYKAAQRADAIKQVGAGIKRGVGFVRKLFK